MLGRLLGAAGLGFFVVGLGFRFHLRQLATDLRHCRFELGDLGTSGDQITASCGDLVLRLTGEFGQRLLKEFDIGLQAPGTTLHLLFGRTDFYPADVLCGCRRRQGHKQCRGAAQKLRRCGPGLPMLSLFGCHMIISSYD